MTISQSWSANRIAALALVGLLAACGGHAAPGGHGGPGGGTPTVGYVTVRAGAVPFAVELPARLSAYAAADVRPQVSGIVRRIGFRQGSLVHKGQTLFQIDPATYQAQTAQAAANLANAEAVEAAATAKAARYRPLAAMQAVSAQDYTDALAAARQARAQIGVNLAQLRAARINLNFTRVPAPITGRIGRSLVTVGALATADQTSPMAQIQQLDPIYADIQESGADLLRLRRSLASGRTIPANARVSLVLEDGSTYGATGQVDFTEAVVDPATGSVTLRATVPNHDGLLLPGMFVRARFAQQVAPRAILVPQQAVTRGPDGSASVLVLGPGDKVAIRTIDVDRAEGANWVVRAGLSPGERVITQGTAKVRPGEHVKAVPADTPERLGPSPVQPAG